MKDYYTVLDLPPNATDEQVRVQYRQLVRIYHPDRFSNSTDRTYAERKLTEINEAYYALLAPERTGKSVHRRLSQAEPRIPLLTSTPSSILILLSVLFFGVFLGRVDYSQIASNAPENDNLSLWERLILPWTSATVQKRVEPPVHDWLSFSVFENYQNVIYVIDEDGQQQMRLPMAGRHPVWSPRQEHIAFLSPDRNGEQLYVAHAAPPPDGQPRARPGQPESKRNVLQLTNDSDHKDGLSWSPDATKLAYLTASDAEPLSPVVKIVNIASGETRFLKNQPPGRARQVTWVDDEHLLLAAESAERAQVYLVALDGETIAPVTHFASRHPAVAPDGEHVVVASDEGIFTLQSSGENLVQLTGAPSWLPRWSADGTKIAYLSTASSPDQPDEIFQSTDAVPLKADLWTVETNGHSATQITTAGCLAFAWSGEGHKLAYVTGSLQGQPPNLYLWIVEDGSPPKLVAEIGEPHVSWGRGS